MLQTSLAPYLLWAKTRHPAPIDLAGSNLLHCTLADLPGARDVVDLSAPNDNGYAPIITAIAGHYGVDPVRVVQAGGCSGANFITVAALVGAGDDVLVERPTYDPLLGAARLMGANLVRFERRAANGFRVDLDDVRRALTPRTRLIIVTTPHNPSGVKIDRATLAGLSALAASASAHVLVDEVYLDGACLVAGEGAASRSAARLDGPIVVTSSLTKSYGLAGLRSGWAIAPTAIADRLRRTRDVVDNASSGPADRLAALAWSLQPQLAGRTRTLLGGNVARAREFFAAHPEFEVPEPPSCSVVFARVAGRPDAELFVQEMLERQGVALAPGRFFEAPAYFRLSLAGRPDALEAGLSRLATAIMLD
jgi:aspartate/methionine/tyrosine aminotransferase